MFGFFAMYVVFLGMGHTLLCKTVKSATIKRYVAAAAAQVQKNREVYARLHPEITLPWFCPIRAHGATRMAPDITDMLKEVHRWENMKDRREPLTTDMIHYLRSLCNPSLPHDVTTSIVDWLITGIYAGFRLSEWAQEDHVRNRSQVKLTIDGDPMAFLISDLEFFGENRRRMTLSDALRRPYLVQQVDVRWCYQKNGNKNEKKTFVPVGCSGPGVISPTLCAVSAWLRIAQRWSALNLPTDHPLAIFTDTGLASAKPEFIRPTHIHTALRSAATAVYNVTEPADLARFSSHSIRVGDCMALHVAGIPQQEIKFALRWRSDSFYTSPVRPLALLMRWSISRPTGSP